MNSTTVGDAASQGIEAALGSKRRKRGELISRLLHFAACTQDAESTITFHEKAEEWLLALVGDKELTDAWNAASDHWWYA